MIDWLMRKLGRKYALVDFYGDIQLIRYYVFYLEKNEDDSWCARWLPNLFVHVFPGEPGGRGPDGDYPHSHPWATWAFVVRGWYKELLNEVSVRLAAPGRVLHMTEKDQHRIIYVKPGTVSLFFHGIRRSRWLNEVKVCATPCQSCREFNGGECANTPGIKPMDPGVELASTSRGANWRRVKWLPMDKDFYNTVRERKAALARAGIPTPATLDAKRKAFKDDLLKRSKS